MGQSLCFVANGRKKWLKGILTYWKNQYQKYLDQSNEGAEWDFQDSQDHMCRPEDPQVTILGSSPKKKKKKIRLVFLHIHLLEVRGSSYCCLIKTVPAGQKMHLYVIKGINNY